jgi:parvulin-like peptidyl-prolyl isomerase
VTPEQSSGDFFDLSKPHVRRSMVLLALGALLGLAIAGYGLFTAKGTRSRSVPPEDLALVNNRPILRSDFMTQVQAEFATPFAKSLPEQRSKVLKDMVAEELQVQRGLEIDLPSFDPDVRNALVAGVQLEVTADVMAQQPTDQELRAYYEAHKDRYVGEGVLRMRDLVAKSGAAATAEQATANAQQALTALRAGMPVEQAVRRYRLEDSGALMAAGHVDTGEIFEFAARAKLAREIYAIVATLPGGQASEPILQSDGVHVVVMLEHRMPVREDYAAAADQVWTDYKNEAQARVREANVRYLRSRAEILLSPEARDLEERAR